jgi:hypothetical protein
VSLLPLNPIGGLLLTSLLAAAILAVVPNYRWSAPVSSPAAADDAADRGRSQHGFHRAQHARRPDHEHLQRKLYRA